MSLLTAPDVHVLGTEGMVQFALERTLGGRKLDHFQVFVKYDLVNLGNVLKERTRN